MLEKNNDSDDDDRQNGFNNNWSKFKSNIQDQDDDDMINLNNENQEIDNKPKEDNRGRHKTFILELVFVNRIIKENVN